MDRDDDLLEDLADIEKKSDDLIIKANAFAAAMTRAFAQATTGAKSFEDALKQLALQISGMAVAQAFRPIAGNITGGLGGLFSGAFGGSSSNASTGPAASAAPTTVSVQVNTPDVSSFRRSEAYLSGQIARAVARGQRSF